MHTIGQVSIEYDESGDAARVTAYFDNPMLHAQPATDEPKLVEVGGYYHHTWCVRPTAGGAGSSHDNGVDAWDLT